MSNLYTQLKIFHYKEKIDSLPKDREKILPPLHVRIKPTNVCNHNCSYCAYRSDNLQLGKDMNVKDFIPRDKMLEIISDLKEMNIGAVTFSGGGDPFCYPYLIQTAQALADANISFAALTNGSNLCGDVAEFFAKKATWLRVSIDGWDDVSYAEYRNVAEGEFSKVMKNLADFKSFEGKCCLGVSIIADRKNVSHIYGFISRLKKIGVDTVKVSPCIISNNGKENNEYHQPVFDLIKDEVRKAKNDFEGEGFEIFDAYHTQLESFEKRYKWCPYLQILMVIGADQNVYSCQDKAYNLDCGLLGSIKDVRFKEFWYSDKARFFKINPAKNCNHHCVSDNKNKMILDYLTVNKDHMAFV